MSDGFGFAIVLEAQPSTYAIRSLAGTQIMLEHSFAGGDLVLPTVSICIMPRSSCIMPRSSETSSDAIECGRAVQFPP